MEKIKKRKNVKIFKVVITIIAVAIIVGITLYLFPVINNLSTPDGQAAFKSKIGDSGALGVLALFGLQIVQIFIAILPGEPIEILAGVCYGAFWGTIIIMMSSCLISTLIFLLVRKYGQKFVYNFFSKERIDKIEKSKFFHNPKTIELIMFILFFIPGSPKDLLVYVSGLLPISPKRFVLISTVARFPSIVSSTVAGAYIMSGEWQLAISIYVSIVLVVLLGILIFNKFDKNKTAKKALNEIK